VASEQEINIKAACPMSCHVCLLFRNKCPWFLNYTMVDSYPVFGPDSMSFFSNY